MPPYVAQLVFKSKQRMLCGRYVLSCISWEVPVAAWHVVRDHGIL